MKYQSQSVALYYFYGALVLFLVQVSAGLLAGTVYILPNLLSETVPFSIIKMVHTNALIVWLLMGFMGSTFYLLPEEAERELYSAKLALGQFWLFMIGALAAVVGYLFGIHDGDKFLEQPVPIKLAIVVVCLMFLFNCTMTMIKGRRTAIANILMLGLWFAVLLFLFAFVTPSNIAIDKLYRWWVVHLWVEATWELILAAILAFLMIKMTGVDREVIDKWLYIVISLTLISGLIGTGHHYFWIGAPAYWQWLGSIFSALEIVPPFALVIFCFSMVWRGRRDHPNQAALLWALGCSVLTFFGAGVWGFLHTLSPINYYTHGTQITVSHGHLAFYGAYVMVNIAMFTYALPYLLGRHPFNQRINMWGFWVTSSAVVFMTVTLTFAGVVQVQLQRVMGQSYMEVQDQLVLFYQMRLGAGIFVVLGTILILYSLMAVPKRAAVQPA